jgi:hypothetical protein
MSMSAQNMKTGPDAVGTAENESGSAKHENGTAQNLKMGPDALGTVKNGSGSAKYPSPQGF